LYFECYVLSKYPDTEFGRFLNQLKQILNTPNHNKNISQLKFVTPTQTTVLEYLQYLRDVRMQKYNSIEMALKCISMTCIDVGQEKFERSELLSGWMESIDEDEEARAELFHPEVALPLLYESLFDGFDKIDDKKKINLWARLLVQIATISRASDICWSTQRKYCPLVKDLEFPEDKAHYREDGMPMFITLVSTDWKGRPRKHRKKPYRIRLWMNPLHAEYCPITWLLKALSINQPDVSATLLEKDTYNNGPIFIKMSSVTYQKYLKDLFQAARIPGHTSHSVRRSAAHWAAQCGLDVLEIKDIGRWQALTHLERYVSEGKQYHEQRVSLRGFDPVVGFWVLNHKTHLSTMIGFN
jgi:hypothetical protein